jgi:hypothetical protein
MTEPIGGQEILVRLAVILVGIVLLIAPFDILPTLGIDSAGYGAFLVFITGFLVVFFSLALWIGRRKYAGLIPTTTKRERLRFVLILAGIILLVSPISTGRGLGISGALADVLTVIIGLGILVVATPAQFRAIKLRVFLEGHPGAGFALKDRRPYLLFILIVSVIGFFMIAFFIPVRSEPTGWYYYTDDSGCTHEYRLGTGPDPNPPQPSITGMYYNLWGLPMEHAYPSDYDYQVCS